MNHPHFLPRDPMEEEAIGPNNIRALFAPPDPYAEEAIEERSPLFHLPRVDLSGPTYLEDHTPPQELTEEERIIWEKMVAKRKILGVLTP